jgi:rfaE bifunctional protein nucleotidyltransferase chain/domain
VTLTRNGAASKIKTLEDLASIIARHKAGGKNVVLCHGVFDLVHPGHIRHFEAARRQGDILVVTVTPDRYVGKGPGRPVFPEALRAEFLASLAAIDYVGVNRWPTAIEALKLLKPSVYVKGSDYADSDKDITGNIAREREAVEAGGGRIHFTDEITFSSSALINQHLSVYPPETEKYLEKFRQRYSEDEIISRLQALKKLRVLVVGDTILDEYHFCNVLGKSPKANALNARFLYSELYAGGVLAVANHLAGFCGDVSLITSLGEQDPRREWVTGQLKSNIEPRFVMRHDAPTTVKRRIVEPTRYTKVFEETFINDDPLPASMEAALTKDLDHLAPQYDLVVVADFGHGLLSNRTAELVSKNSRYLAVNAQANSANFGYNLITKYPRAAYACLDEPELRLASHDKHGPLNEIIEWTSKALQTDLISVTQAHHGSTTYTQRDGFIKTPVFSTRVVDTLGAGDAYLALTAPCASVGTPADLVGFIGNVAGALKVEIIGNKSSVEPVPVYKFITTLLK